MVVVEENHSASDILSSSSGSYFNELAASGLSMTDFYAISHPSQPNYLALFSGTTQGLTDDSCPHSYDGPNLGSALRAANLSFAAYAESLPHSGYLGCSSGPYARKHAPWTNFRDLPADTMHPFTAFPSDYQTLPTLSFVIPNLDHDMHDGTAADAASWLQQNLGGYAQWARTHDSLLVVTWDEDDHSEGNRIPTIAVGQRVRPGEDSTHADLYSLLATLESLYHLPALGESKNRRPIAALWTG